jgi:PadR family transcriptional regulator PadR
MPDPRMTMPALRVLAAMLERPTEDWYGFTLIDRTDLKSGTLYPLLARLEQAGWLESRWEAVDPHVAGRPRRRLYALTASGESATRAALDSFAEHRVRSTPDRASKPRALPKAQFA